MNKKMEVGQEGPMYTQNYFCASVSMRARTAAIKVKISEATYIRSEKLKKQPPLNMARGNQISNVVGTGPKAHQTPPRGDINSNYIVSDLRQTFRIGSSWSSKVIVTNRGMQDWSEGPQRWAEGPPLIF